MAAVVLGATLAVVPKKSALFVVTALPARWAGFPGHLPAARGNKSARQGQQKA